ncbi:MAG: anthranilate synthase component I family protein [Deltaproteobacteria bacterium]|jgi:anthranilate synthase component 1|nr:anthranilate synthase component I family protein [Deltaproteobacteria bacterium]
MNIRLEQSCAFLESDVETPISLFLRQIGQEQGILLESAEVDGRWGRYSVIAGDFLLCLHCRSGKLDLSIRDARLEPLAALAGMPFIEGLRAVMRALEIVPLPPEEGASFKEEPAAFPPITRALYGYFGYGIAGLLESKLAGPLPPEKAEACLVLPGSLILFDHSYNRVCRLFLGGGNTASPGAGGGAPMPPAGIGQVRANMEQGAYLEAVRRIKERIRQGEAIQVVPSVGFEAPFWGEPFTVYRRLRRINPSPYMFFMRLPDIALMGSSPEVMVSCDAGKLRLCPIAGTRPRGSGQLEDNLFEEELVRDPKEQAEHVMLVDLGRNDLGRVAVPGSVRLERYMEVERFSHVMHLTSHIRADLAPGHDALDILAATFPAGTVSGAPKIRAMEIIAATEPSPRGPYAGAIGWLGLDKDGVHLDTGIAIRSLWMREDRVFWQAGGGVVFDSSPENEWKELNSKAGAVLAAVAGDHSRTGGSHVSGY